MEPEWLEKKNSGKGNSLGSGFRCHTIWRLRVVHLFITDRTGITTVNDLFIRAFTRPGFFSFLFGFPTGDQLFCGALKGIEIS